MQSRTECGAAGFMGEEKGKKLSVTCPIAGHDLCTINI